MRQGERRVDVWTVTLDIADADLRRRERLLSGDERARAAQFAFEADRNRFVACRGRLREILSTYVSVPASKIAFERGGKGKPFLAQGGIHFSVAHSHDLALVACCAAAEVGVDIERVRELPDAEQIVRQFFAPADIAVWIALADGERRRAFFDCWTRKEAYLKALGDGLSRPLDSFHVPFWPREPAHTAAVEGGEPGWWLFDVSPADDYAGALAVSGRAWQVCWRGGKEL
jgi:4'-phosphopantetheinyl transferase